jgi:hypothetical protein
VVCQYEELFIVKKLFKKRGSFVWKRGGSKPRLDESAWVTMPRPASVPGPPHTRGGINRPGTWPCFPPPLLPFNPCCFCSGSYSSRLLPNAASSLSLLEAPWYIPPSRTLLSHSTCFLTVHHFAFQQAHQTLLLPPLPGSLWLLGLAPAMYPSFPSPQVPGGPF